MSGAAFDRKISRGLKIVGKKLGFPFTIYRPDNYFSPVSDRNKISTLMVSYSEDERFLKSPENDLAYYRIFCDYSNLNQGDILVSEKMTFTIFQKNPLRPPVGVMTNQKADLLRATYSLGDDVKSSLGDVATSVPCELSYTGGSVDRDILSGIQTNMGSGISAVDIWMYLPPGYAQLNDVVRVDGKKFIVQQLDSSDRGTFIKAISTELGQ